MDPDLSARAALDTKDLAGLQVTVPHHVLTRSVDGELVLLSLESEEYYGLDQVGAAFWHHIEQHGSVARACDALLAEYDVEAEALLVDIRDLLHDLDAHGLLRLDTA